MQNNCGAPPFPRFDDEICELLNIQNIIGLSDAQLIRKYKAKGFPESPNTIRSKLKLLHGCTPVQFKRIKVVVMESKKEWENKLRKSNLTIS